MGYAVIMLAVGGKPLDFLAKVTVAEVAFAGAYLPICKCLRLVAELSGNVLGVGVKLHLHLILPSHGGMEYIIGHIAKHIPVFLYNALKHLAV